MNKIYFYIGILFTILLLTGCAILDPEDQFYEKKVSNTTLHTITPIEPNLFTAAPKPISTPQTIREPNLPLLPAEMNISIEECRALTLQNNLDLQTELINPTISTTSVAESEAIFEPEFSANTNFSSTDTPGSSERYSGSGYQSSFDASQSHDIDSSSGVKMPLRTGGILNFSLSDSRIHNLGSGPQFGNAFAFSISQPLLKNAGQRITTHYIRLARYNKQITDNTTKAEIIRVLADTDKAYWQLYAARKELEVREKQHELAIAQLERAKRQVAVGQMAKVEIIRAEAGVARQLAAIITAENNLRKNQRVFKKIINKPGIDIETSTIVIPATEVNPVKYVFDPQKLINHAYENRKEFLDLELQIAKSISTIDYLNNQMLPLVLLDYRYQVPGKGQSRSDSLEMLNRKRFETHTLGISLTVPLGNEAAKNQLLSALYTKRQQLSSKVGQQQLVKQEVLDALDTVETSWQQILASRQAAILEGNLYETEVRQFEVGLRTSTDVLDAQARFANAQSTEIASLVDYEISLVDLAYATGTLLGADKIIWEPITPPTPVQ